MVVLLLLLLLFLAVTIAVVAAVAAAASVDAVIADCFVAVGGGVATVVFLVLSFASCDLCCNDRSQRFGCCCCSCC